MSNVMQPISIVVPALNEADNLALLVNRVATPLREAGIDYEIILLDDHSTDHTKAVAKELSSTFNIRHIMKVGKRGKAYSLLEAFELVNNPIVCMIDADLQYPPEAILPMYQKLVQHDADVVVTNRIDQKTSIARKASTKIFHFLMARMLFGIDYDTQSGLKLFKKSVLEGMDLKPSAWSFDLEFLIRSLEKHCRIVSYEIPFSERHSGVAKVKLFNTAYELANASIKLRFNSSIRKVRRGYRANVEMSRRPAGLVSLMVAGTLVSSLLLSFHPQQAAAISLLQPVRELFSGNDNGNNQPAQQQPAANSNNTATDAARSGNGNASQPAAAPANTATPAAPAATPAQTARPTAAQQQTTAATGSSDVARADTAAQNKSDASPVSAANGTASGTDYYASQSLSPDKTSALTSLSKTLGITGAAAVGLGLVSWIGRKLYQKRVRKASRNLYQV